MSSLQLFRGRVQRSGLGHTRARCAALTLALALAGCSGNSPSAFVASAKTYMAKGEYTSSIIQLKNALRKDPKNAEARYLLGQSELKNGDAGAAEIELRKAADLGLASDDLQVALARAEIERGHAHKVIVEFGSKTLTSTKMQAELRALVGTAQLALDHPEKARKAFDEALSLNSTDVTANLGMARLAASKRDFARATRRVDAALGAAPSSVDALLLKAQLLEVEGKNASAADAYRKAIPVAGHRVPPRLGLIELLIKEHAYEKAHEELVALEKVASHDPRTVYAKAMLLLAERKYAAAVEAIQAVLKVAPNHVPSLLLAGTAALDSGAYSEAENYLRRAAYDAPDALAPKRLLATTYLRLGKTDLALAQVKDLLAKDGRDPAVLALAGETYLARGDVSQAAHYYGEAKSLAPGNAQLQTRVAEIRFASGERNRAIRELESISASHPHEFQSDLALITAWLRQRQPDKAIAALQDLEKKQPDNPLTYNLRGLALLLKHDVAGARSSFEHALQLQPTYMPAVVNLATLDLRDGKMGAAKQRYLAVLKKAPNNEQALLRLAVLLRISGADNKEIEKLLKQGIAGNPNSAQARLALINFYLANRASKDALSAAQSAQAALPHSAPVVDALGVTQLASGNTQAAISTFAQLAGLLPNSPAPLIRKAQAYIAAKQPDQAIQALRAALALRPGLTVAERDIAAIYVSTGRSDEAVREAKAIQAKYPKQPFGYALEAEIYVAKKEWRPAIRIYREALRKFQLPLLVLRTHAIMEAAGRKTQADALAESWIKDHPKGTIMLGYLAQRDVAAKRYAAAVKRYQTALDRRPGNPMFLNNMAWAMYEAKQPHALEYAQQANRLAPDNPAILDTLGSILVQSGELDRGLELLGRASELAPRAYQIRLHFAKALIKAGRETAARKELEVLAKLDKRLPVQQEAVALLAHL